MDCSVNRVSNSFYQDMCLTWLVFHDTFLDRLPRVVAFALKLGEYKSARLNIKRLLYRTYLFKMNYRQVPFVFIDLGVFGH